MAVANTFGEEDKQSFDASLYNTSEKEKKEEKGDGVDLTIPNAMHLQLSKDKLLTPMQLRSDQSFKMNSPPDLALKIQGSASFGSNHQGTDETPVNYVHNVFKAYESRRPRLSQTFGKSKNKINSPKGNDDLRDFLGTQANNFRVVK